MCLGITSFRDGFKAKMFETHFETFSLILNSNAERQML